MARPPPLGAALVGEMMESLREEVKKIEETNWLYGGAGPQLNVKFKI